MDLIRLRGLIQADALYNRNGSCRLDQSPAARAPRRAQKRSYVVPPPSVVAIAVMFSPLIHHSPVRCTSLSLSCRNPPPRRRKRRSGNDDKST